MKRKKTDWAGKKLQQFCGLTWHFYTVPSCGCLCLVLFLFGAVECLSFLCASLCSFWFCFSFFQICLRSDCVSRSCFVCLCLQQTENQKGKLACKEDKHFTDWFCVCGAEEEIQHCWLIFCIANQQMTKCTDMTAIVWDVLWNVCMQDFWAWNMTRS